MNNAEEFVKGKMKNIAQKVENELPKKHMEMIQINIKKGI